MTGRFTEDEAWAVVWDRSKIWVVYLGAVLVCGALMRGCP